MDDRAECPEPGVTPWSDFGLWTDEKVEARSNLTPMTLTPPAVSMILRFVLSFSETIRRKMIPRTEGKD